eukprot:gene12372-26026_t
MKLFLHEGYGGQFQSIYPSENFAVLGEAEGSIHHDVVFCVAQKNTKHLHDLLMEISDVGSLKYGQYLSKYEIADITENKEGTEALLSFLSQRNIEIISSTIFGEYIRARATVNQWNSVFYNDTI